MVGSSGYKGISRIDSPKNNTFGWYVRVQYAGQTHSRFFSDSAHGGEQKGLAKAVRHRNQLERSLGKPRTDRTVTIGSARNRSGVQGVKRVAKGSGYAYEVTWSPEAGVVHRTTVSIQKFGEDEAFRRACRIRQLKERKHYGGLILKEVPDDPPEEKPPAKVVKSRVKKAKAAENPFSIEAQAPKGKAKMSKAAAPFAQNGVASTTQATKKSAAAAKEAAVPPKSKAKSKKKSRK